VHPRVGLEDLVLGEHAAVADAKLDGHLIGERVCNLLVRVSADDTDEVAMLNALANPRDDVCVEPPPMWEVVVKRGHRVVTAADNREALLLGDAWDMLVRGGLALRAAVRIDGMPEGLHHDCKLAHLLGERACGEVAGDARVRKTDYVHESGASLRA